MPSCDICKFSCKFRSEFDRHLKSKRHLQKSTAHNCCISCLKQFTTKFNKDRHEKKCITNINNNSSIDNSNNSSIDNSNNTTNNTTNNQPIIPTLNVNINLPNGEVDVKNMKSYVMEICDLMTDKFTDCLQKLVIHQMENTDCDIMDFLEEIDNQILKEWTAFNNFHKNNCFSYKRTEVVDENGVVDFVDEIVGYNVICIHHRNDYKLDIHDINKIITNVLLKNEDDIVVTHQTTTLSGKKKLLYKHLECLHNANIIQTLLDKSKHVDKFFIGVAEPIEESEPNNGLGVKLSNYNKMYAKLEKKAKSHINKFNSTK